jgi:hypothetical protein
MERWGVEERFLAMLEMTISAYPLQTEVLSSRTLRLRCVSG